MATGQLWLFPPPRTLVERFGEDFFRELPAQPGVYLFCGAEAGVLYIGKAKNLRQRLASYRVANPERFPRRLIRLLNQITRIEFDVCANERAVRHREELLICVLAPKFNRAGKVWPRKLLHEDDVFTYNRTVPKIERTCANQTAATKITLIGGD
jgi:excinuclease UvrABC nuclease subunit